MTDLIKPRLDPPSGYGDDHAARYERGRRMRQALAPQYLPHTIILDIMRERAASRAVVSTCPPSIRLTPDAGGDNDNDGGGGRGRRAYLTGDYTVLNGWWRWAVDALWYDYRHACFVAEYMDQPPAYMSREFGWWAVLTWTISSGWRRGDAAYAQWLAWFHCAPWKDVVVSLGSSGDGADPARLLRWPPTLEGWYPPSWMTASALDPPSTPQVREARWYGLLGHAAGAMRPSMWRANTSG